MVRSPAPSTSTKTLPVGREGSRARCVLTPASATPLPRIGRTPRRRPCPRSASRRRRRPARPQRSPPTPAAARIGVKVSTPSLTSPIRLGEQIVEQVPNNDDPQVLHASGTPFEGGQRHGLRAARRALRRMMSRLTSRLSPFVSAAKRSRRKGVTSPPRMPRFSSPSRLARSARSCSAGSSCSASASGLATTRPDSATRGRGGSGSPAPPLPRSPRSSRAGFRTRRGRSRGSGAYRIPRRAHRGLQVLQGRGNVEDGFDPGADHGHGRRRERRKVRRDVRVPAGLPVYAAEAAGGEEAYPRKRREMGGRRYGRGPWLPFATAMGGPWLRASGYRPRWP